MSDTCKMSAAGMELDSACVVLVAAAKQESNWASVAAESRPENHCNIATRNWMALRDAKEEVCESVRLVWESYWMSTVRAQIQRTVRAGYISRCELAAGLLLKAEIRTSLGRGPEPKKKGECQTLNCDGYWLA